MTMSVSSVEKDGTENGGKTQLLYLLQPSMKLGGGLIKPLAASAIHNSHKRLYNALVIEGPASLIWVIRILWLPKFSGIYLRMSGSAFEYPQSVRNHTSDSWVDVGQLGKWRPCTHASASAGLAPLKFHADMRSLQHKQLVEAGLHIIINMVQLDYKDTSAQTRHIPQLDEVLFGQISIIPKPFSICMAKYWSMRCILMPS